LFNHTQTANLLKSRTEKLDNILHAQGVFRRPNCLDKSFLPCRDKPTTLKLLVYSLNRSLKNFVNSDLVTANNCILGKSKKASQLHYAIGDYMPRSLGFYFGSVIFFIGVLLMAIGISKVIVGTLDLSAFVELISGVVLIIIGSRAIRSVQR
jgi:uncharacterized membrane protein